MAPTDYAGVVSNCSIGQWPEVLLREEGNPDAAKTTGHYPLGHNLRTKLRTRSTKVSLEGTAGFGAFAAAVGAGVTAAAATPSTRPWKMSAGRTRTRRTRTIIFGSTSGWTLASASKISGGMKT